MGVGGVETGGVLGVCRGLFFSLIIVLLCFFVRRFFYLAVGVEWFFF